MYFMDEPGGAFDGLNQNGIVEGEWDWEDELRRKRRKSPYKWDPPCEPNWTEKLATRIQTSDQRAFGRGIIFNEYMRVNDPDGTAGEDSGMPADLAAAIRDVFDDKKGFAGLYDILENWYREVREECRKNPDKIREYSAGFALLLKRDLEAKKDTEEETP